MTAFTKKTLASMLAGVALLGAASFAQAQTRDDTDPDTDAPSCQTQGNCGGHNNNENNNNNNNQNNNNNSANASNSLRQMFTYFNMPGAAAMIGQGCTVVDGTSVGLGGYGVTLGIASSKGRFLVACEHASQMRALVNQDGNECMQWVGATAMGLGTEQLAPNTGIASAMALLGADTRARNSCTIGTGRNRLTVTPGPRPRG